MDIYESGERLVHEINGMILQKKFAEKKAKEYEERIYQTIKKIEYCSKHCGYDGETMIHDKELNELLDILEGKNERK